MVVAAVVIGCEVKTVGDLDASGSSEAESTAAGESTGGGASASETSNVTSVTASTSDASGSESGGSPIDIACDDPQPILQVDGASPSGFVMCSDGFRHREAALDCVLPETGDCDDCATDCSELANGRCVENPGFGECICIASCETDADCGEGKVCACTGPVGPVPRCVAAACTTTADCGAGLCGISGSGGCGFDAALACLDAESECRSTVCDDTGECVCYSSGGEFVCHDECFSGCG